MPTINGSANVFSFSPMVCRYDNGTDICDRGYKLKYPGRCLSQSAGKANSTGFEPEYSICFVDYISVTGGLGITRKVGGSVDKYSYVVCSSNQLTVESGPGHILSDESEFTTKCIQVSTDLTSDNVTYSREVSSSKDLYVLVGEVGCTSDNMIHHAGKNIIPHLRDVTSEYWVVDTYSHCNTISSDFLTIKSSNLFMSGKPEGVSRIVSASGTSALLPYSAITGDFSLPLGQTLSSGTDGENPGELCVDDLSPPVIYSNIPEKDSRLNPVGTGVEFKISDPVGGVDIGVLSVVVSGTQTLQPGGRLVVSSGVDNSGGYVSITGDITEYTITYAPENDWQEGEFVYVTVQCQDLIPQTLDTQDWSCYDPDVRNVLDETFFIGIADIEDFSSTITAIPDVCPPYLSNVYPEKYIREVDSYTYVQFDIVDDITGVDLTTINISVDDQDIVINGVVQTSEASLSLIQNGYRFYYKPLINFDYGLSVFVVVEAYDSYELSQNWLYDTYHFTIISSDTSVIENFSPEENSSHLAETKDVCVDVYDTSFGLLNAYFIINGSTYLGNKQPIYGNTNLSTTVSGINTVSGTTISGVSASSVYATFSTISGTSFSNGDVLGGDISAGDIHLLQAPFNLIPMTTIVSGTVLSGTLVSGTFSETLVSGVNWDGKYINSSVYDIGISGGYFVNTTISGATVSGIIGYTMCVHPDNDFNFGDIINVYVHTENANSDAPVVLDELYQLYYGYRVLKHNPELGFNQTVSIFARAVNKELIQNNLSSSYTFTTYAQPKSDIPASVIAKVPWSDMSAEIDINAPTQSYGETIQIELYVEDEDGNALGPYIFSYTVEDS